jgi:hypothetical protein
VAILPKVTAGNNDSVLIVRMAMKMAKRKMPVE